MTPYQFLLLTLGATAAGVAANQIYRRKRQRALAELAKAWRMHYSPRDLFQLAVQIAPRLPELGAADVSVVDVIYGIEGDSYRYIFSVEYTLGIIQAKRRVVRAASLTEPRGRSESNVPPPLELADSKLPLLEQYSALHAQFSAQVSAAPA